MSAAKKNEGKILQVLGSVVDVVFDELPEIYNALEMQVNREGKQETVVAEVQQHMGGNVARCVALSSTDGLVRGQKVLDRGEAISVPVGEATLGRIFNVLGDTVDEGGAVQAKERRPIHQKAPLLEDLEPKVEIFETGIKVIDFLAYSAARASVKRLLFRN